MKRSINVLIVEDNEDDFVLMQELLESSEEVDCKIFYAERIEQAKTIAKTNNIEIAIIDLSLPDSFGLETFRNFHKEFPMIPIVIMTGSKNHELAIEAVKDGAQDYLFKGENSTNLTVRTLIYAIERQRLICELKRASEQIKQLKQLLPICAGCKKIRNDAGYWQAIESYISEHTDTKFSHGICPECVKRLYPEYSKNIYQ